MSNVCLFRISVRGGTNFNDLQEIEVRFASRHVFVLTCSTPPSWHDQVVDLNEPAGWIVIPLKDMNERLVRKCKGLFFLISNARSGADVHAADSRAAKPSTRQGHTSQTGRENVSYLKFVLLGSARGQRGIFFISILR